MCHPEVPAGHITPVVAREEIQVSLGAEQMPALLTRPEGVDQRPAVLVIHDIFGRSPFYEDLAARLTTAGFVALLPDFFFRQGPLATPRDLDLAYARHRELDEQGTVRDLRQALALLEQQPGVDASRVGVLGFCMGGTLALNLAARGTPLPTVAYYPFPGPTPHPSPTSVTPPIDLVDRIRGPVLAFWGAEDHGVGMDTVEQFAQALLSRGVDFEYTIYPGLGHGFLARSRLDPTDEAYERACDSWTRTVDFYRLHLTLAQPLPA